MRWFRLKMLNATERMILDEADKSSTIRVDRSRFCIAPKVVPAAGQGHEAGAALSPPPLYAHSSSLPPMIEI